MSTLLAHKKILILILVVAVFILIVMSMMVTLLVVDRLSGSSDDSLSLKDVRIEFLGQPGDGTSTQPARQTLLEDVGDLKKKGYIVYEVGHPYIAGISSNVISYQSLDGQPSSDPDIFTDTAEVKWLFDCQGLRSQCTIELHNTDEIQSITSHLTIGRAQITSNLNTIKGASQRDEVFVSAPLTLSVNGDTR